MKLPALALLAVSLLSSMSGGDALATVAPSSGAGTLAAFDTFPGRGVIGHGINLVSNSPNPPIGKRVITYKDGTERVPTTETSIGDVPEFMLLQPYTGSEISSEIASSVSSLMSKMTVSVSAEADVAGFEGSVESRFSKEQQEDKSLYVATLMERHTQFILEFDEPEAEDLEEHLSSKFLKALNGADGTPPLSPEDLFEKYGTHVVTRVELGGRVDYWFSSEETESMTEEEFDISIKASYSGVSGAAAYAAKNVDKKAAASIRMTVYTVGGEDAAASKLRTDKDPESCAAWVETIPKNTRYVGRPKNSLMEIWEFCESPRRAKILKAAYRTARAKQIIENPVLFTKSASAPTGYLELEVPVPNGYKVLSGGAQVNTPNLGIVFSCPTSDGRGWMARAQQHLYAWDSGALTVSALAIYDPENFFNVVMVSDQCGESVQFPQAKIDITSGYSVTGGGARTTTTGVGNFVWMSQPLSLFRSMNFPTSTMSHSLTAQEVRQWYGNSVGRAEMTTGWVAIAKDFGVVSEARITTYCIGIRPMVKDLKLETKHFTRDSSSSTNPKSRILPEQGYTLVGGGGMTTGINHLLTASTPVDDGEGGFAWYVESHDHEYAGNSSAYAFAVGLKVLAVR